MMKNPVLEGELAPNVAIQFRLRILQSQDAIEFAEIDLKENYIRENYQSFYALIGALINKMLSAPVFKGVEDVCEKYDEIENTTQGTVWMSSYGKLRDVYRALIEIIKASPIYAFEFREEEVTVLEG